jgi:hypothetical protein
VQVSGRYLCTGLCTGLGETAWDEADAGGLPLVAVYTLDDEWGQGWGRSVEQLTGVVREACEEQLSKGTPAT